MSWSLALFLCENLIRLVMLPVVVIRKERPATCLAWLAVIFFQPWIGLALYLLIGEVRIGRRRLRARTAAIDAWGPDELTEPVEALTSPHLSESQSVLSRIAERIGGFSAVNGNHIELMTDSRQALAGIIAEIDAAQHHVHLLFYIFRDDPTGCAVVDALLRARSRGVEVRLLVDAAGSRMFLRRRSADLQQQGVQVVPLLPASFLRRGFARLDLRNHRKVAVIDGAVGFVGSQNIVEPDYGHKRIGEWHDIMARLTGPIIGHLQQIILEDWFYETGESLDDDAYFPVAQPAGAAAAQVVPTGPDQPHGLYQDLVVLAIHSARKHITITTPYFVPDEPVFLALRSALLRDVCVDLVIPEGTDRRLVDAAASYYWNDLLKRGSNVYQHSDGLLHAKTLSVDDALGMFGSANFDIRSFHLNFELSLLTYDANVTAQLKKLQDDYLKQSKKLDQTHVERRPLRSRVASGVAKVLSPIL